MIFHRLHQFQDNQAECQVLYSWIVSMIIFYDNYTSKKLGIHSDQCLGSFQCPAGFAEGPI